MSSRIAFEGAIQVLFLVLNIHPCRTSVVSTHMSRANIRASRAARNFLTAHPSYPLPSTPPAGRPIMPTGRSGLRAPARHLFPPWRALIAVAIMPRSEHRHREYEAQGCDKTHTCMAAESADHTCMPADQWSRVPTSCRVSGSKAKLLHLVRRFCLPTSCRVFGWDGRLLLILYTSVVTHSMGHEAAVVSVGLHCIIVGDYRRLLYLPSDEVENAAAIVSL